MNDRKMRGLESWFGGRPGGTCDELDARSESDRIKERCSSSDLWSMINTKQPQSVSNGSYKHILKQNKPGRYQNSIFTYGNNRQFY